MGTDGLCPSVESARMQQQLRVTGANEAAGNSSGPKSLVHLVDDDESFRKAASRLLQAAGYEVRSYASGQDFLMADLGEAPSCLLLDLRMRGASGLDLQKMLETRGHALPIIFITGHGDVPSSVSAFKQGATDFLTKPVSKDTLFSAVEHALRLDTERRTVRERLRCWRERFDGLTARERQVFAGVTTGKLNKQIAGEIGAGERTVKAHRASVMEKMKAGSVAELVHIAEQLRAATANADKSGAGPAHSRWTVNGNDAGELGVPPGDTLGRSEELRQRAHAAQQLEAKSMQTLAQLEAMMRRSGIQRVDS
jgi:FixJ family two-component response regulator